MPRRLNPGRNDGKLSTLNSQLPIRFGTAGWRAVIGEDFTFANVKIVSQAIADYVNTAVKQLSRERLSKNQILTRLPASHLTRSVVIGYDTRFLAEEFAQTSASVLAANKIQVQLSKSFLPTPAFAYEIICRKTDGGINFTASHNPPEYQGMKFSGPGGLPAVPEVTSQIEKNCQHLAQNPHQIKEIPFTEGLKKKLISPQAMGKDYLQKIKKLVDFDVLGKANLKIVLDLLYGTSKGYLDELLLSTRNRIFLLHNWRDVLFAGRTSEPNEKNLGEAKSLMKKSGADLGLATDGDADRFGILDAGGSYLVPNEILGLVFYYLLETRKCQGVVVRSVMTTHFLDALAKKYNVPVRETPVGFKFIGEIMSKEPVILGGEESGGLSILGHIPEKDGILACLLVAELRAWARKKYHSLRELLNHLYAQVGEYHTERINFSLSEEVMQRIRNKLSGIEKEIDGIKVEKVVHIDGHKFIFSNGSWLGFRLSGTEPVVRCYIEARSKKELVQLRRLGKRVCLS